MSALDRKDDFEGRPHSGAGAWIVRDADDRPWGPFNSAGEARAWAERKWPDVPFKDDAGQGGFWDIEAVWPAD